MLSLELPRPSAFLQKKLGCAKISGRPLFAEHVVFKNIIKIVRRSVETQPRKFFIYSSMGAFSEAVKWNGHCLSKFLQQEINN